MKKIKIVYIILFFIFFAVESCRTSEVKTSASTSSTETTNMHQLDKPLQKGGAALWGENCARCHNVPPAQAYSNEQWDVIGQHMRVRANISKDKTTEIIAFIKSIK